MRSCNMAEGTRLSQLAEVVNTILGETATLKGEQDRHKALIEGVLQQLTNLASSYNSLVQITVKLSAGEGASNNVRVNANPLFDEHGGIQARTLRLDFPRFDGGDPSEWILKAQQFFTYCQMLKDHKLQIASFHIEGKALSWYYWLMESSPVASWEEFLVALRIRFGPSAYEDPVGGFTKLRQTGSVEEYQTTFEILSNKITEVRTDQQVLKHFLEQRVGTPFKQKWVAKLLGFNFSVEYRSGKENKAVDALSRLPFKDKESDPQGSLATYGEAKAISVVNPNPKLSPMMEDEALAPKPEKVLAKRLKKKGNQAGAALLVQWKGSNKEDATWVDIDELWQKYPELMGKFF
ncbi:hypothetical protein F0562_010667 [Nyssa sinensis]|uniref:Chromo domain-containing protein n=1 Tax=Nyssa sinensis TaxID=561372 RepID=A0A5J5A216_9ASTE|nr:hypothetical protein F0562_010667 [Nyssa sinensis]